MGLFARNMSAKSFFAHAIYSKGNVSIFENADSHNQNQQKKKEFHFSDGSIGYFVSNDGQFYGVTDAMGNTIIPQKYRKIACYGNLLYCQDPSNGKKYSCALYYKDGQCKVSEAEGFSNLEFVYSRGKLIVTSNSPMAVFNDKGEYMYKYKKCKDSNGFLPRKYVFFISD